MSDKQHYISNYNLVDAITSAIYTFELDNNLTHAVCHELELKIYNNILNTTIDVTQAHEKVKVVSDNTKEVVVTVKGTDIHGNVITEDITTNGTSHVCSVNTFIG